MSSRARELMLEFLLLKERYAEEDWRLVQSFFAGKGADAALSALMKDLVNFEKNSRSERVNRKEKSISSQKLSYKQERHVFLLSIQRKKSPVPLGKIKDLMHILDIPNSQGLVPGNLNSVKSEIISRIKSMNEEQWEKFSKILHTRGKADEGYLDLANYIMQKPE